MVLTTPEALEQRTVIASRAIEELRGYGLNVNDNLRSVVERTTAAFGTQREVTDTTYIDRVRTDLVRTYGGRNAESAIAIIRARDFIVHDLERAQRSYDAFLDGRTSPDMLANNLEVLKNEIGRYRGFNRFSPQMDREAQEAEFAINRIMRNLTEFPTEHNERMRAYNEIFRDFNALEAAMNRFAETTNGQIATIIRTTEQQTQVAVAPRPQAPVREVSPTVEVPTRPVVRSEPQPRVDQTPVAPVQARPPQRPVIRPTEPVVEQTLIAIDTPQGQRRLGTLLQTQNPNETAFSPQQMADIGRLFSELRRYPHFREEWNESTQESLLQAYRTGGRMGFINEVGLFAQVAYNPDRDTTPIDGRLDDLRASVRTNTRTVAIEREVARAEPEVQHVENPLVTMFNDRIRDGNQTVDAVRTSLDRIHQARLDAQAAVARGDSQALARAQQTARDENSRMGDPVSSLNTYLGYARSTKERISREEARPLEQVYRTLERRRDEIVRYQRAVAEDMGVINGLRIQNTRVEVPTYVPQAQIRTENRTGLSGEGLAQFEQIRRLIGNAAIGDAEANTNRTRFLFELQSGGMLRKLEGGSLRETSLNGLLETVRNVCDPTNPASNTRKTADINRALLRYETEALAFVYTNYFTPEGGSFLRDTEAQVLEARLEALRGRADQMIRGNATYAPATTTEIQNILRAFGQIHEITQQNLGYEENERRVRAVMLQAGLITNA
jgi:hypothetical protein